MKTLILLGNAPVEYDLSALIDSADCVVRLNECRNYGLSTGSRTDILFLNNTGDPRKQRAIRFFLQPRSQQELQRDLPYTLTVGKVVFVRPKARDCRAFLERHIPENKPLRSKQIGEISQDRDLGREIVEALRLGDRIVQFVTPEVYSEVWETLLRYGQTEAIMPSTGIVALEMLRRDASFDHHKIHIAGFTHEGWEGHPWELERKLVRDYIAQGLVVPLDGKAANGIRPRARSAPNSAPGEPSSPRRPIRQLILVSNLVPDAFEVIRARHPASRVVFLDCREPDTIALRKAAELAGQVVAQDELFPEVSVLLQRAVASLSCYDPEIARMLHGRNAAMQRQGSPSFEATGGPVLFCPFNDTHVQTLAAISRHLPGSRFLLSGEAPGERAEEMLVSMKLDYVRGTPRDVARMKPSVLVVAKDWSQEARRLIAAARDKRIPVACVQEGPTEFNRDGRMQWCDFPLIQGPAMLEYLDQKIYFLAGNARFDRLEAVPLPAVPTVMLNCNFWNDKNERERWLEVAVSACRTMGLGFFVSRHPRDNGYLPDLPTRRSGPDVVHGQIADSSIVVTPHSSIIYEALLMGRAVICHDPRRSRIEAFDDDRSGAFMTTKSATELVAALGKGMEPRSPEQRARIDSFLDAHCGARDGKTALRCASALQAIARQTALRSRHAGFWSLLIQPFSRVFPARRDSTARLRG